MKTLRNRVWQNILAAYLCGVLLLATSVQAQDQDILQVDPENVIGEISPFVYGANYGPYSAFTPEMLDEAAASGVQFLRFPGGRWGDLNDLQPFHIDMYMRVVDLVGAVPSIHVRLENGTPEAAAELVRYTNIEQGYDVRYWSIGNEPNLFEDYTVDDLNREWRPIAEAMLAVDPTIMLIGPDLSQWNGTEAVNPVDSNGKDWLREFLRVNGDMIDIVAVHRYPFPRSTANPTTSVEDLRSNTEEWDHILPNLRAVTEEVTGRDDLLYAVTEVNSHWSGGIGGEASNDSFYNAIWWADVLGKLIQDEPFIVNFFDLQSDNNRGGWGMIANYEVRPTYYVYQMYQQFGTQLVESQSGIDDVSINAALHPDGTLRVVVVNLSDEPQQATPDTGSFTDMSEIRLFDKDHAAELVDTAVLFTDRMLQLPPQSVVLLVME